MAVDEETRANLKPYAWIKLAISSNLIFQGGQTPLTRNMSNFLVGSDRTNCLDVFDFWGVFERHKAFRKKMAGTVCACHLRSGIRLKKRVFIL